MEGHQSDSELDIDADGTDDELDNEDVTGDVEPKCALAEQCEFNISVLFY